MGKWLGRTDPAVGRKRRSGDPRRKVAERGRGRTTRGKAPSALDRLRMRLRRRPSAPSSRMRRMLDGLTGHRHAA